MKFSIVSQSESASQLTEPIQSNNSTDQPIGFAVRENIKILTVEDLPLVTFLGIIKNRISTTNFSALDPSLPIDYASNHFKISRTTGPFEYLYELQYLLSHIGHLKVAFNGYTLPLLENLYSYGYLTTCSNEMLESVTFGFIKWCPIDILHDVTLYLFQPSTKMAPFTKLPSLRHLIVHLKNRLMGKKVDDTSHPVILTLFESRIINTILQRASGTFKRIGKVSPWFLYQSIKSQNIQLCETSHRHLSRALFEQNVDYCLQHFKDHKDKILSNILASTTILIALVNANKFGTLEEVCNELVSKHGELPIFYSTLICAFLKVGRFENAYSVLSKYQGTFTEEQSEPICFQLARLYSMAQNYNSNVARDSIKAQRYISQFQLESFLSFFLDLKTGIPFALGSNFPFLLTILFRLDSEKVGNVLSWLREQPSDVKKTMKYIQLLMSLPILLDTHYIPFTLKAKYFQILLKIFPESSFDDIPRSPSTFVNDVITPSSKTLFFFFRLAENECNVNWDIGNGLSNAFYFSIMHNYLRSDFQSLVRILQFMLKNVYISETQSPADNMNDFDFLEDHQKMVFSHVTNASIMTSFHIHPCLSDILLQACIKSYDFDLMIKTIKTFKAIRLPFNKHYFVLIEILESIANTNQDCALKSNYGIISDKLSLYELSNNICPEILLASDSSESTVLYDVLEEELNIKTVGDIRVLFETDSTMIPKSLDAFKEAMAKLSLLLALPEGLENSTSLSLLLEPIKLNPLPLRFLLNLRK